MMGVTAAELAAAEKASVRFNFQAMLVGISERTLQDKSSAVLMAICDSVTATGAIGEVTEFKSFTSSFSIQLKSYIFTGPKYVLHPAVGSELIVAISSTTNLTGPIVEYTPPTSSADEAIVNSRRLTTKGKLIHAAGHTIPDHRLHEEIDVILS